MSLFRDVMLCVASEATRNLALCDRRVGAYTTVGVVLDGFLLVKWLGLCAAALYSMRFVAWLLCTMAERAGDEIASSQIFYRGIGIK
jgi:hypothetical protein